MPDKTSAEKQNKLEAQKAFTGALNQAEVNYVTLSPTPATAACANCRWFLAYNQDCFIVNSWPQPILPTGICDRHEENPPPPPELQEEIIEAVSDAVVTSLGEISDTLAQSFPSVTMGKQRKPFLQRAKEMFGIKEKPPADQAFSVFKGVDGEWYWHAVHTNNFEDLEGEILTAKGHDNYIARVDMGLVSPPVLQAWHTPGSEHGVADVVWRNDHFVHAVGHFTDDEMGQKAIAYYSKNASKLKMSHGFTSADWAFDGKHYNDYNTIEITTLPAHAAANPYTSFEEILIMPMTKEKEGYLKEVFGEDGFAKLQAKDSDKAKALETLAVNYKDLSNVLLTPPAAPAATLAPSTPAAPASAPAPAQGSTEREKALAEYVVEMSQTQDQIIEWATISAKALNGQAAYIKAFEKRHDEETAAWQKQIDELREQLNLPIVRGTQSPLTVLSEATKNLTDMLPASPLNQNPSSNPIAFLGGKERLPNG